MTSFSHLAKAERFFRALANFCPLEAVSHLYLDHWPAWHWSPVPELQANGFAGQVVAGRASIRDGAGTASTPVLDDHPTHGATGLDHILMELPQGREAARLTIQAALDALNPDGALWLFGPKDAGINAIQSRFTDVDVVLYKGHLRLLRLPAGSQPREPETRGKKGHGQPQPTIAGLDAFHTLEHQGITLASLPGVFSWQHGDPASRRLLECCLKEDPGKHLLDWGCGYGLLGLGMARQWPKLQVMMSDDQWRAVRCTRESIRLNGLEARCQVVAEDGIGPTLSAHAQKIRGFNVILSNPPFHRGTRTDHEAARRFIAQAMDALTPTGRLWLVGPRTLPLGRWLEEYRGKNNVQAAWEDGSIVVWRAGP